MNNSVYGPTVYLLFSHAYKINKMYRLKISSPFFIFPSTFSNDAYAMKTFHSIKFSNSIPFISFSSSSFPMHSKYNGITKERSMITKKRDMSFSASSSSHATSPSSLYSSMNEIQQKAKTNSFVGAGGMSNTELPAKLYMSERSINRVSLLGRLGFDCEAKFLQNGDKFATLNVATNDVWRDKLNGELRSRTEWHRVVIFDTNLAEFAEKFAKKGRKVYVEGSLQTRRWQSADGTERFTTEVVISRFRGELILVENSNKNNEVNSCEENEMLNFNNKFNNNNFKNTVTPPTSNNLNKQNGGLYNRVLNNSEYFDGGTTKFER
ncbi:MAG: single-stranded DNA-binding protein [Alphaproteobacteria bacterium]|nr:single-stranded DNA-binding protein [Alphaproteobacteria bacterium]